MKIVKVLNKDETFEVLGEEWQGLKHKAFQLGPGESIVVEELKEADLVKLRGKICYWMLISDKKFTIRELEKGHRMIKRVS